MNRERREKIVLRSKIMRWKTPPVPRRHTCIGERDVVQTLFGNYAGGGFENSPGRLLPPFSVRPAPLRFALVRNTALISGRCVHCIFSLAFRPNNFCLLSNK